MPDRDKLARSHHDSANNKHGPEDLSGDVRHQPAETDRPDTPQLEGGTPLPEEVTGRASGTDEELTALFDNESAGHLADGFRGGSADEPSPHNQADGTGDSESGNG
jgi:hypothetical protein